MEAAYWEGWGEGGYPPVENWGDVPLPGKLKKFGAQEERVQAPFNPLILIFNNRIQIT